jgi:hypothetical protein
VKRWQYYRDVPFSRLWALYAAVFCLFAITGFFGDLVNIGRTPYVVAILNAIFSGFVAMVYVHIGTRLSPRYFLIATVLQIPLWAGFAVLASFLILHFHLQPVSTTSGIRVAAIIMLALVIVSYSLFIRFLRGEGREAFRLRNELELAHGIQKTLVPPIALSTLGFDLYGRSDPSDKVGGDLVDAVHLPTVDRRLSGGYRRPWVTGGNLDGDGEDGRTDGIARGALQRASRGLIFFAGPAKSSTPCREGVPDLRKLRGVLFGDEWNGLLFRRRTSALPALSQS